MNAAAPSTVDRPAQVARQLHQRVRVRGCRCTRPPPGAWPMGRSRMCPAGSSASSASPPREPDLRRPLVLLYQPQSAFNGLLIAAIGAELHVLLQARVEPGNIGVAQYGPTVQSTPANYLRVHGGRATPYLDFFHRCLAGAAPVGDWTELDSGRALPLQEQATGLHRGVRASAGGAEFRLGAGQPDQESRAGGRPHEHRPALHARGDAVEPLAGGRASR